MGNSRNTNTKATLKDKLGYGDINKVVLECGLSRYHVSEFINDPEGFTGSVKAKNQILDAINKVLTKKEAERQKMAEKLNKLLTDDVHPVAE